MLKPYVPKQCEREPIRKPAPKPTPKTAEERKVLAYAKLARLRDQAKSVKVELEALRGRLQPFEWLLPVQYRRRFSCGKENESRSSNELQPPLQASKYHLFDTAIGAAMIKNEAKKSLSLLKPMITTTDSTVAPTSNQNLREKILKELSELRGLEKREHIVRCINDSRAKYSSKPITEQTKTSFEERHRQRLSLKTKPELPSTDHYIDLAYSTVSIISGGLPNPRCKPTSLICPDRHEYYSGELLNNQPHGHGRLVVCCPAMPYTIDEGVEFYNGSFQHGKFHGLGTLSLRGGVKYVGSFKDGLRDGQGSLYANGKVDVCIWRDDKIVQRL